MVAVYFDRSSRILLLQQQVPITRLVRSKLLFRAVLLNIISLRFVYSQLSPSHPSLDPIDSERTTGRTYTRLVSYFP